MKRLMIAMVAVACVATAWGSGKFGSHKPDGTNVWVGAASGGNMSEAANWAGYDLNGASTDPMVLMTKHVVLDLRGLASGAVLTDDLTCGNIYPIERSDYPTTNYVLVVGIILNGQPGDTWTVNKSTGKGLFFGSPCYLDIDGGALIWDEYTGEMYPYKNPHKRGTGELWFKTTPMFWESDGYADEGTLGFTNGTSAATFRWKVASGAKIAVAGPGKTSNLSQIYSPSDVGTGTAIDIRDGATLSLNTGFNNWSAGNKFYGDVTGSGKLRVTGGGTHSFYKGSVSDLSFTGIYQPYLGVLQLGESTSKPLGVNSAAGFDVAGPGWAYLYKDATISSLSGTGADGGIQYPATSTLTVEGGAATNVFSARLKGGDFVTRGANHTLVLTGENLHTGETKVEGGTLKVKRGFHRPGLRAYWNFENADDMGADASADGIMGVVLRNDYTFRPHLIDDGVVGKALHFGDGNDMTKGGVFFRARKDDLSSKSCLPRGSSAFTFSFWLRPTKGKCGAGTNFIHFDGAGSDLTTERGETSAGVSWGNGFYFGTAKYDFDGNSSASFKNICFYCGCGWTRGGAWADDKKSKPNAEKVVYANFTSPDYLLDGNWHHVVGTYSNRLMRIYVDGVMRGERTRSADLNISSNPYIQFGNYAAGDTVHTYQGDLDEIQWLEGAWSEADVAAEYAARNPRKSRAALLPAPVAHWTFDEMESDKSFRDVTGNGFDLANMPSNTTYVTTENVTYPGDSAARGKAARITANTSYLKLKDGVDLTTKIPNGSSFTLSMRCAYPVNHLSFLFGNGDAANSVRLTDGGTPRLQSYYVGNSTALQLTDSGCYGSGGSQQQSAYMMNTIVYDANCKTLRIYRDGVLQICSSQTFTIKPTQLQWGRVGNTYSVNLRLDDLRLYNEPLTGAQVAELARVVRHVPTSSPIVDTTVLPTNAVVNVSAGATFTTDGASDFAVGQMKGAGAVNVRGGTTLRAADWSGFTGTVSGDGYLPLTGLDDMPAANVSANVRIDSPVLTKASAGSSTPLVATTGRVVVPDTGTFAVPDATSGVALGGKRWALASGSAFDLPADLSGWTVSPAVPAGDFSFKVVDQTLYFTVKGGSTMLIVR